MATGRIFETTTNTYREQIEIGSGGSGTVLCVKDVDGAEFALKILRDSNSTKRKRFLNELNFCQQERHPNIVRVLDHGLFDSGNAKAPFYVMPYYPETLRGLMSSRLPAEAALRLFDKALSGVEAAHLKGVIHRDLKPENILCDSQSDQLLIGDFGIAHFEEEDLLTAVETKEQDRLANFVYAAPEQKIRGETVDLRADIFALGLILNEMFTGKPPLATGHPLIANVSPSHAYLDDLVRRMILQSPEERYPSIGKVKEDLLARGNAFIALQKLDEARRMVIPAETPDDPLRGREVAMMPPEYKPGELVFTFRPTPPQRWLTLLSRELMEPTFRNGFVPHPADFYDDGRVGLPASEATVGTLVNTLKSAVKVVNEEYRAALEREAAKQHRDKIAVLERNLKAAEEVERVNRKLKELV